MMLSEPFTIALLLAVVGVLLAVSALSSRLSTHAGVPAVLLFLGIGMLAGSEGLGGIKFDNFQLAFQVGTVALALILFDGGLNTPEAMIRRAIAPAGVLATVGVVGTALLVAVPAHLLGFGWLEALLLGAVVSSTDAAAVFSILRGSNLQLRRRVAATLDLESGLNDPVAVILTIGLTLALVGQATLGPEMAVDVLLQLAIGGLFGLGVGYLGRWVLRHAGLAVEGLYPVLTLAFACLAFSLPTLVNGSGFLSVYVAGAVLGNGAIPYRGNILRAHDFLAWFGQVFMFLTMGLLVFPSQLLSVAGTGIAIGLFLAFVARPAVVLACLAPFRFSLRESTYIGWVGLRGAVPIILATFPLLAGVEVGERIFNVVFFVVVLSVVLQGSTTGWLGRRLDLERYTPPFAPAVLEISSGRFPKAEILSFFIRDTLMVTGARLRSLPLPRTSSVVLVSRGEELFAPRDELTLEPGDHIYVLCRPEDRALVRLLFGHEDDDA